MDLRGIVQGVGFRPYVFGLAAESGLGGFVRNTGDGVTVEVEGLSQDLERFLSRFDAELPPRASIFERRDVWLAPKDEKRFSIEASNVRGAASAFVTPDLATCNDCLKEIFDPVDRRFGYAFTTCAQCGPRYSIMSALPYDRERTTMRIFPLCAACRAEYENPNSRRFHAESIACPDCGPRLALWDRSGRALSAGNDAVHDAVVALRQGAIVGIKGLGGFQFLVDAFNEDAVQCLRARKQRPRKPFAVMAPTMEWAQRLGRISDIEQNSLASPQAPIVLLRAGKMRLVPGVAPGIPNVGIMLPSTPLHHLLLRAFAGPVVATSGNVSGEPLVADEFEALRELGTIADLFLVHDRPIAQALDDSVVRVMAGRVVTLRCARGYAPMTLSHRTADTHLLALGGQQKNAIATGMAGCVSLGPHIGDLSGPRAREACNRTANNLASFHSLSLSAVACDAHPDYYTTQAALRSTKPVVAVPHHLAHVLACMADNQIEAPVLGVAWDGTGFGADGTIWGGEFIRVETTSYRRCAYFLPFPLPGGESAVREPRRAGLGMLFELLGEAALSRTDLASIAAFSEQERSVLGKMLTQRINAPLCSSLGRMFDAVSSLLGFFQRASFEGEAAMAVEFAAERAGLIADLPMPDLHQQTGTILIDWRPMIMGLLTQSDASPDSLAAGFHECLARTIVAVASRVGLPQVLLTGGCFQNARLIESAVRHLHASGFVPLRHRRIPPNDGGLAVGQIVFAANPLTQEFG